MPRPQTINHDSDAWLIWIMAPPPTLSYASFGSLYAKAAITADQKRKEPMFRMTLSILAAFVASAAITVSSVDAQPSRGMEGVALVSIKDSIVKAIGAAGGTIELTATARIFTVKVLNGKFIDATTAGRENEAGAIEAIVAKAIAGKSEFKSIVVIVVQYLKRRNGSLRIIDLIEFRKDATGEFRHHVT
jgi:hypothetical protein